MSRRTMVRLSLGIVVAVVLAISVAAAQGPPGGGPMSGMRPAEQESMRAAAQGAPSASAIGGPVSPTAGPTAPTGQPGGRVAAPAGISAPMAAPTSALPPGGFGAGQAGPMMTPTPMVQQEITRTGFNFTAWLVAVAGLIGGGLILRRFTRTVKEH